MAIINPIHHLVYDNLRAGGPKLPIVEVAADSEAYGTIYLDLPTLIDSTSVAVASAGVYRILPPSSGDPRWRRDSTDLRPDTTGVLFYSGLFTSVPQYEVTWRFCPTAIDATSGTYYSAEFYVNLNDGTSAKDSAPKVILKIKDIVS